MQEKCHGHNGIGARAKSAYEINAEDVEYRRDERGRKRRRPL